MRFSKTYLSIAPLLAWLLVGTACQSRRPLGSCLQHRPQPRYQASSRSSACSACSDSRNQRKSKLRLSWLPKPTQLLDFLARVEKQYQAGQVDFKAGRLQAAKQNFDHALDMLAKSGMDVKSDPRLQQEFDQLQAAEKTVAAAGCTAGASGAGKTCGTGSHRRSE